jgi:histidinol-phosphate/aromatic aminotransferase/cobyric acid decarboxylase-like protein
VTGTATGVREPTANGAGFVDADCVSYYRTIRADVPASARQIGYGVNKMAPAALVRWWLAALYGQLLADRVTDYSAPADERERALVAALAGRYLGTPVDPDGVFFCHGSTEAISVVLGFAGARGMRALLPLPLYCSFEQSAVRHGVPVAGHYNAAGRLAWSASGAGPLLAVDIAPNGVTGTWFSTPPAHAHLRVVDHVFALPTYQPGPAFLAELRRRTADLHRTVVFLTPSKDLSIPGLRCGTIITGDPDLRGYIRADRFERGYAPGVGTARVAAAHLALLLLAFAQRAERRALQGTLRGAFRAAHLAFPADSACESFVEHLDRMRHRSLRNIELLDATGFLAPLTGAQVAGYSGFRRLAGAPVGTAAFTGWIHATGRAGLKLNPNGLFGADPARWQALYPGGHGVRVNVSVPPDELAADLALLRRLLPA